MTIRVLLADDQALLRSTFRMLIDSCDDMTVVGEAADGAQAVDLTMHHRPDVVLMDIRMPGTDGLAATQSICSHPALTHVRVLILTTFETDDNIATALRNGASGFLGKDTDAARLLDAIRTVAAGEALLSPTATRSLIDRFLRTPVAQTTPRDDQSLARLTDREREVTLLAAQGLSNAEIADHLYLSPLTVRTHVHRAMAKLDARDRTQLVVIAYQSGAMSLSSE